jgi:folate-dependent phosphoribosylglycinamide formyltransferase PurN
LLTFAGCRKKYGVQIETTQDINGSQSEQMIQDWTPDVIVSARFSLIFKKNIEAIPRLGVYNIHPGALPGYAGLCAPLRGLLNGEVNLGCTLHQVDMGIDTGPVYSVSYMPAAPERSVFSHIDHLYELGLASLTDLLKDLESGQQPALKQQNSAEFRYYRLPDEQVFAELREKNIEPVSFEIYSQLIQKFCPDRLWEHAGELLSPAALARLTTSIHTSGADQAINSYCASIEAATMTNGQSQPLSTL